MPSPNVITGIVRDSNNKPVAQARLYFTSGPGPFPDIAVLTNDKGEFSITAPLAGSYTLACSADGYKTRSETIRVEAGKIASLVFNL